MIGRDRLITTIVYDHPLVRVTSRKALLSHFMLLHLVSTLYLPALTPTALLHHARGLTSYLRGRLIGLDDLEAGEIIKTVDDEEYTKEEAELVSDMWWRVWDVDAACKEIGGMVGS